MTSAKQNKQARNGVRRDQPRRSGRVPGRDGQSRDVAGSYNAFKEFDGRRYTGMKVGRSHKWYYDQGEWKETKVTPDEWQFSYAVDKRRAGKAPEGSGVPVGTEYHWLIVAHQTVQKLNANDYSTSMHGVKFKVAHKRADTQKWSASDNAQRKRMIGFLQEMIGQLEREAVQASPVDGRAKKSRPRRSDKLISR
jgi:hypothetical protein